MKGPALIPEHLPDRLTICLWDFSWYTQAGPGQPYSDLGVALDETAARGYNTIRICAAPLLLFGGLGLDDLATALAVEGLGATPGGGYFGRRTRWYNTAGGFQVPVRERLFELLAGARERGLSVILSTWEYQQSTAFAADRRWFDAIETVPITARFEALAAAFDLMLNEIHLAGLDDVVAFVELHNEVDFSRVPGLGAEAVDAVGTLRAAHPGQQVTVSLGKPPHVAMHTVPAGLDVGQFHVYSYGVLDALQRQVEIRESGSADFPNAMLHSLQRAGSPSVAEYGRPADWKLEATVITDQMLYGYDTVDPDRWDAWLYENYGSYRALMYREVASRVKAAARWGAWRGVPVVIGEGWVGYTPLEAGFEEGPAGKALAEHGMRTARSEGVWGVATCSNAAPHHPMWADVVWQRRVNDEFRDPDPA
ncbi:MAG: hypothetical protein LBK54_04575 [Propionibacteriaceae bacterium]|jgi:hypothetical protein|nr:hypothetical protein [Propionibacteriaceae bacterium]